MSRRLYGLILRFYPKAFRLHHAGDMLRLFLEMEYETSRVSGWPGVVAFWIAETFDGVRRGVALRLASWRRGVVGRRPSTDVYTRRPAQLGVPSMLHDIRFAVRSLQRQPIFAIVAVLTIGLGMGANTAIFAVANSVLFRPLPFPDAERLVSVGQTNARFDWDWAPTSYLNYSDWRDETKTMQELGAYGYAEKTLLEGEPPRRIVGWGVTASFFSVLQIPPQLGRSISSQDEEDGAAVIVLSDGFWAEQFGADSTVLGRVLIFDDGAYTVVGIMPRGFHFPSRTTRFWIPLSRGNQRADRGLSFLSVIGRLAPGETVATAGVEMSGIAQRLRDGFPDDNEGIGSRVRSRHELVVGDVRPVLMILLGASGVVLAIACANIASLLLSRASTRQREIAVRTALGAGRARLIRQLLTESTVVALLGGAFGVVFAAGATRFLLAIGPANIPRRGEISIDGAALLFTLVVSLACGVVFGAVPALQSSSAAPQDHLKQGMHGSVGSVGRHRLHQGLVVSQIAMALVLLIGAGLLSNSFVRLLAVDLGFAPEKVIAARITLPMNSYDERARVHQFFDDLRERVASLPGVTAAATTFWLPFTSSGAQRTFIVEGNGTAAGEEPLAGNVLVSGDYHRAMGVAILSGRGFSESDVEGAPMVTVINEAMAREFFPDEDPIGKRLKPGAADQDNEWLTVVGVSANVRRRQLGQEAVAEFYQPHRQAGWGRAMFIVARTDGDPLDYAASVRREVGALDPELPVTNLTTMSQLISDSVAEPRFRTVLVGVFALVAGFLALIGIYGVMAFVVNERTREIGVRMALGAAQKDVLGQVLLQGMRITILGLTLGGIGALAATRVLSALLFGIGTRDPLTFFAVASLLAIVAAVACLIPAMRASKVDPMVAMRIE